jgi:WD40 repeat protein
MVSSGLDGFIHIWNVRTGLDTQKWSAATSPIKIICTKSGHLVTGSLSSEDALKLWNPNTSTKIF